MGLLPPQHMQLCRYTAKGAHIGAPQGCAGMLPLLLSARSAVPPLLTSNCCCYCCSHSLIDQFTVHEMLMYTAELKLPLSTSPKEKRARVEGVIEALSLGGCRNTRIGRCVGSERVAGEAVQKNARPTQWPHPHILPTHATCCCTFPGSHQLFPVLLSWTITVSVLLCMCSALAGTRAISKSDAKRTNIGLALVSAPRVLFLDEVLHICTAACTACVLPAESIYVGSMLGACGRRAREAQVQFSHPPRALPCPALRCSPPPAWTPSRQTRWGQGRRQRVSCRGCLILIACYVALRARIVALADPLAGHCWRRRAPPWAAGGVICEEAQRWPA